MDVSKNLWYIRFYKYLNNIEYDSDLPQDSCELRNKLILTAIIFPLTAPVWILVISILRFLTDGGDNTITHWGVLFLSFAGTIMSALILTPESNILLIPYWFIGPVFFFGGLFLLIGGLYYVVTFIGNVYGEFRGPIKKKKKKLGVIAQLRKSYREKYCEKINWK